MGFLKTVQKSFGTAMAVTALALSCGIVSAAPTSSHLTTAQLMDRAEANTLISQVSAQLAVVGDNAATLSSFVRDPEMYTREAYSDYLDNMKVAVNKAQESLSRVEAMRMKLTPLQIETAAKLGNDLNKLASETQSSIQTFDSQGSPIRLENSAFPKDIDQIYEMAQDSHRIARDYLTWEHDSAKSQQALKDFDSSAS